jgi:hypothetical protein
MRTKIGGEGPVGGGSLGFNFVKEEEGREQVQNVRSLVLSSYLLTAPWSRVLLKKLTGSQLVNKCSYRALLDAVEITNTMH